MITVLIVNIILSFIINSIDSARPTPFYDPWTRRYPKDTDPGISACSLQCFDKNRGAEEPRTVQLPKRFEEVNIALEVSLFLYHELHNCKYNKACQLFQACVSGNSSDDRIDHYVDNMTWIDFIDVTDYYDGMNISTITLMPLKSGDLPKDHICITDPSTAENTYPFERLCDTLSNTARRHGLEKELVQLYAHNKWPPPPMYEVVRTEDGDPSCIRYFTNIWNNYCEYNFFDLEQSADNSNPLTYPFRSDKDINKVFRTFFIEKSCGLSFRCQLFTICIWFVKYGQSQHDGYKQTDLHSLYTQVEKKYGNPAKTKHLQLLNITIMPLKTDNCNGGAHNHNIEKCKRTLEIIKQEKSKNANYKYDGSVKLTQQGKSKINISTNAITSVITSVITSTPTTTVRRFSKVTTTTTVAQPKTTNEYSEIMDSYDNFLI
ncbi:SWPV2-ORF221 [Shearwaterpox virus]|uniref:SWPV2-ORF221 n=1 Tax=Shearwaterpox virus TaxID=1974596 RepID=A0A1V0QGJ8_CNPV|nr:SWPV2-ORF221 [Shearwaterpox virus]